MAQSFGKVHLIDEEVVVSPASIQIGELSLILSYETDMNGGPPYLVIRTMNAQPIEVRPVAGNTIGVRVVP